MRLFSPSILLKSHESITVSVAWKLSKPSYTVSYQQPAKPDSMSKIPEELTKRYYTISEVAEMFDVSKSLVRFWEQEFDFLKPYKSSKGERRFTADNIKQFEAIYHLVKEKGYTLSGAKKALKEEKEVLKQKNETLKTLVRLKGFLEDLKNEI